MKKIDEPSIKINRRCALAGFALSTVAIATRADAAGSSSTDPHTAWLERWIALTEQYENCEDDEIGDVIADELHDLSLKICRTKATTIRGVIAQIEWFDVDFGEPVAERPADPFWGILAVAAKSLREIEEGAV